MKKFKLAEKYTHYAILKSNNKILNGWNYKGVDTDDLKLFRKDYFLKDLSEMYPDIKEKEISVVTEKYLTTKLNINYNEPNNWYQFENKNNNLTM